MDLSSNPFSTTTVAGAANAPFAEMRNTDRVLADSRSRAGNLRVLHLVDTLQIGGTETQMAQVVLRLAALGYHVTVGCLRAEGPLLKILEDAGIAVVEFRKETTLMSASGLRQLFRLIHFLRCGEFHVLHAHDLWSNLLGVPAARLARTPVIISSRRYLADLAWYRPWRNRIMGWIYRLSTCVVVNSHAVKSLLLERHRLNAGRVHVIHNGVDFERLSGACGNPKQLLSGLTGHSKVIGVLANMYSTVKGHSNLIAAADLVCQLEPDALFVMIGDGPERSRLEQKVSALNRQRNFVFLGRRLDVPELLSCCDVFVLPSESEALPNSLLEAMAAGLPVVTTAVGGVLEIIEDEIHGLLVPVNDPQSLAGAIVKLLQNPALARRLAQAACQRVKSDFCFERLIGEIEGIYGTRDSNVEHQARCLA